jgi:hypothetical protein
MSDMIRTKDGRQMGHQEHGRAVKTSSMFGLEMLASGQVVF